MERSAPRRLRELASWRASQVARRADRLVTQALAAEGARKPHFSILAALAEADGLSQAELGRRVWIDRSDLHTLLAELERDGLIARTPDERDRRRNVVTLTPAGATRLDRLEARVRAAQEALLAPLAPEQRHAFLGMLERLLDGPG